MAAARQEGNGPTALIAEVTRVRVAASAVPDMQDYDRILGQRVIDTVGIARWWQEADFGMCRHNSDKRRIPQPVDARKEIAAHSLGAVAAGILNEVVAYRAKIVLGLAVKPDA